MKRKGVILEQITDPDSYHATDEKGVPIGNLTSKYFANHYLSYTDNKC